MKGNFDIKSVRKRRDHEGILMLHISIAKGKGGTGQITYIPHFL